MTETFLGPPAAKGLRARDTVAMCTPTLSAVFVVAGSTAGALGIWGAALVCTVLAVVSMLQNYLFAEMAAMFPGKSGGVALFAAEAWKKFSPLLASIASFGYWCGWGLALSLASVQIGHIVTVQWFPAAADFSINLGIASVGLPQILAAAVLAAAIGANLLGLKVTVSLNKVVAAAVVAVLAGLVLLPMFAADWSAASFSFKLFGEGSGVASILVWMYVGAWSIYASELCATFAPEYRRPVRDTKRALKTMAMIFIMVYALVPITTAGAVGEQGVVTDPVNFGVNFYADMFGPAAGGTVAVILVLAHAAALLSAAADASHALKGLAEERLTIRQLARTNRRGAPSGALVFTLVVNLVLLFFVGSPVAIVIAANLGYMISVTLACAGFLVMRRTHADVPRPLKLGRHWIPVAVALTVFNGTILVVGALNPGLAAGGQGTEIVIALILLLLGGIFYWIRRRFQPAVTTHHKEPALTEAGNND
ncbi:APC family permease [Arthrobacter sp. GCM10027362]|uniref:APC family permease n=1 Tax=Arthrobacter sp. GCM10027362 TaxID=3273379 RepID=UPI00363630CE